MPDAGPGTRPRTPHDQRTKSAYIFGAICPERGIGAAIIQQCCNTAAMQQHLEEISAQVRPGVHALLILDRAGWHTTKKLDLPTNITLLPLPPRPPELNPTENIWQYIPNNWLSDIVFESQEDITDHCCEAWNNLIAQPDRIKSVGHRSWAIGF